ncbi:hypothetical protein P9281_27320 [Caballeronia sp. LP003]|uniref:hypothetical protein n=1 Tax=Caballeronia sp. LP003 TaxID=3038551 RepID=UPI002866AC0E|nr:hypothetical protein [Caballeronia sp. LP003]MDR5790260.1 hypothetical protein [Caballeronia sp. LP003]
MDQSDQRLRDDIYEMYELSVELGACLNTARSDPDTVSVPRSKLSRFVGLVPFIAGYAMAVMPLTPTPATKRRAKQVENADPALCAVALAQMLKHVDYTSRKCTFTEQIGAVLPVEVIYQARAALNAYKGRR